VVYGPLVAPLTRFESSPTFGQIWIARPFFVSGFVYLLRALISLASKHTILTKPFYRPHVIGFALVVGIFVYDVARSWF